MRTIGQNVRQLRLAAGHKHQGKFAGRAGFTQQWLSDLENNRYPTPDTASLIKLAIAIPCTIDDLVAGTDTAYDAAAAGAREKRPRTIGMSTDSQVIEQPSPTIAARPDLAQQMAWEFRRAANAARRAAAQALLRDIAWSLEQVSAVEDGEEERPAKRRRARA